MFNCNFCSESFKTKNALISHQNKAKYCQKYRNVMFTCHCGFKTNGIKNIDNHIIKCDYQPDNNITINDNIDKENYVKLTKEKDNLLKLLSIERTKCSLLSHIIEKNTNINISDYITTENDVVNFFNQSSLNIKVNNDLTVTNKNNDKKQKYRHITCLPMEPEKSIEIPPKIDNPDDNPDDNIIQETEKYIDSQYEKLKDNRNYTKILDDIKNKRKTLLDHYNLNKYIEIVQEHINKVKNILESKKYNNKKIEAIILKSLLSIEARITLYFNYFNTFIDMEEIEKFKKLLDNTITNVFEFVSYNESSICNYICNYGLSLLPIFSIIKMIFCKNRKFSNVIYVSLPKSTKEDPYSFYRLDKVNSNSKRQWKLDWRLEDLSLSLSNSLLNFMIVTFRKIYKDVFLDNDYRENYISHLQITECDLEQLLQNIITVSNQKQFCINLQKIIIENCTYNQTENDKFNLIGDDTLQRKKFHDMENKADETIFTLLFDNITKEKSILIYKNRIT
jgi:hypothetical protein